MKRCVAGGPGSLRRQRPSGEMLLGFAAPPGPGGKTADGDPRRRPCRPPSGARPRPMRAQRHTTLDPGSCGTSSAPQRASRGRGCAGSAPGQRPSSQMSACSRVRGAALPPGESARRRCPSTSTSHRRRQGNRPSRWDRRRCKTRFRPGARAPGRCPLRGAPGAGLALVAGKGLAEAEIGTASALEKISGPTRGHVAQLLGRRPPERLGEGRIFADQARIGRHVAHPRQRAEDELRPDRRYLCVQLLETRDVDDVAGVSTSSFMRS